MNKHQHNENDLKASFLNLNFPFINTLFYIHEEKKYTSAFLFKTHFHSVVRVSLSISYYYPFSATIPCALNTLLHERTRPFFEETVGKAPHRNSASNQDCTD